MNDNKFTDNNLIKYQQLFWYLAIIVFGFITFLYFINSSIAPVLAYAGIILVLVTTLFKLVIMAEKFRTVKRYRLSILSYFLIILLLSTILLR